MLKSLAHTAVAAWIAAALFVSPILAAIECRQCCNTADTQAVDSSAKPAPLPACCVAHPPEPPQKPGESCPSCPKCAAKRPVPAVADASPAWKLPVPAILQDASLPEDVLAGLRTSGDRGRRFFDRATPPPRVLFCTWQK